ncbi:unnamed protein product [Blepharisma stoltei]|uniref:SKP1-like protein n=1 Tax=Blepharisma stoltei TaxID=1481888 RepID=A0AAU9JY81_9CILI|nr:unnamed protein product [Blepharisma stoltei]
MSSDGPQITLVAKDSVKVKVSVEFRNISHLIKSILEDSSPNEEISVEFIQEPVLAKIIEFAEHHHYRPPASPKCPLTSNILSDALSDDWDINFVKNLTREQLIDLIQAARYLDVKSLLDICIATLAASFKGKEIDDINREFNIIEDFTFEEEEKLKNDFPWVMDMDVKSIFHK